MTRSPENQISGELAALLRLICARPDEDAPRLRYADHLEETGDPNDALRAEFIQIACELTHADLNDARWFELRERLLVLDPNFNRWVDELPRLGGVRWNPHFRRGFAWDVWCDNEEAFVVHAPAIFAAAPIQSLSFRLLQHVKPVVDVPEFSRITCLILEDFRLGPAEAQALADAPNAANITELHLSGNQFGDAGIKALASSRYLLRLRGINLAYNEIGDEGVKALANSPIVASLSTLGLAGNPITNIGAATLASSPYLKKIDGLTLWDCDQIWAEGRDILQDRFGDAVSFDD